MPHPAKIEKKGYNINNANKNALLHGLGLPY